MSMRRTSSLSYVKKYELKKCFVRLEKLTADKLSVKSEIHEPATYHLRTENRTCDLSLVKSEKCGPVSSVTSEKSEKIITSMSMVRTSNLSYVKKYKLKKCFVRLEKLTSDKLLVNSAIHASVTDPSRSKKLTCDLSLVKSEKYDPVTSLRSEKHKFNPCNDDIQFSESKSVGSERCNICLLSFQSRRCRWLHLQQEHKEEIPFMCRICLRVFFDLHNLLYHGLVPCKCAMCDKNACKLTFEDHLKICTIHNPYICKLCSTRFSNIDTFHDHMKEHEEGNSFCKICCEFLITTSQKKRHLKKCQAETISYRGIPIRSSYHADEVVGCRLESSINLVMLPEEQAFYYAENDIAIGDNADPLHLGET